jgi:3-dehydroshikimate dehydratase
MIKPGLVSITFRQLTVEQIVELAEMSGLMGIEWSAQPHVPHGNIEKAEYTAHITREAGLEVAAYGSYYRAGISEDEGHLFALVLETAAALGTGVLRVWAGRKNSQDADEAYWKRVVDDSRRIAELAAARNIRIVYEFHEGTLTNTYESCKRLLEAVDRPNVLTYWQPLHGADAEKNVLGMQLIMPWIAGAHVFHWWPTHETRHTLETGKSDWIQYFEKLKSVSEDIFGLLEFSKDDSADNFKADAVALKSLIKEAYFGNKERIRDVVPTDCSNFFYGETDYENM